MRKLRREEGQATLEYLLVGLVLIALMGALGALWRFAASGSMSSLVEGSSSHTLSSIGGVVDALLF